MGGMCQDRIAIITGAGRGLGRAHALELARQGANVVVNDLGSSTAGTGADTTPAEEVVQEIVTLGGKAVVNTDDISDWEGARRLIHQAIHTFGRLDILVNNAGILRDRMLVSMTPEDWDMIIRIHLRGTFATSHFAANHWRQRFKEEGPVSGRLINTTSASGIYGNVGQANYGAAKAGIASFTVIASMELARYGVTANAVAPVARTRLTESLMSANPNVDLRPEHVSPLIAWLASLEAQDITGRVFDVGGGKVAVAEGWHMGPAKTKEGLWTAEELRTVVPELIAQAAPNANMQGTISGWRED
jgi:NAD(P)-dependent dehydrogenase (short-subunit alcohol dehydrogenase family)